MTFSEVTPLRHKGRPIGEDLPFRDKPSGLVIAVFEAGDPGRTLFGFCGDPPETVPLVGDLEDRSARDLKLLALKLTIRIKASAFLHNPRLAGKPIGGRLYVKLSGAFAGVLGRLSVGSTAWAQANQGYESKRGRGEGTPTSLCWIRRLPLGAVNQPRFRAPAVEAFLENLGVDFLAGRWFARFANELSPYVDQRHRFFI